MTLVMAMTDPIYDFDRDEEIKSPEPTIPCSCCTKKFSSEQNLLLHQIVKHRLFPYRCTKKNCGQSFLTASFLDVHINSVHAKKGVEKLWRCTETEKCIQKNKTFDTKAKLNAHVRRHGAKHHKCAQCDKSFVKKCELDAHMRTHNGEKQYACPKCKKFFSSLVNQRYHEKNTCFT